MNTTSSQAARDANAAVAHQALRGDEFVSLMPQTCLAVRAGESACSACVGACPANALAIGPDGPTLQAACLHCGRCAAACPTGALHCDGFDLPAPEDGLGGIRIECAKVPAAAAPHALRVPCQGGIAPTQLLAWMLAGGERALQLVDRGWCAHCSAGCGSSVAQMLVAKIEPWLQACGVPPAAWPVVRSESTPVLRMPDGIPVPPKAKPVMDRRAFFRRIGSEVRQRQPAVPAGVVRRSQLREIAWSMPARERWLERLAAIAARHGRALPAAALPALAVDARCADHGVCAGVCPTGALLRNDGDGASTLSFDAARCVACGRCAAVCPEQALRLDTGGGDASRVVLRRSPLRECVDCGAGFAAASADARHCARCSTSANLARALFGVKRAGTQVAETQMANPVFGEFGRSP